MSYIIKHYRRIKSWHKIHARWTRKGPGGRVLAGGRGVGKVLVSNLGKMKDQAGPNRTRWDKSVPLELLLRQGTAAWRQASWEDLLPPIARRRFSPYARSMPGNCWIGVWLAPAFVRKKIWKLCGRQWRPRGKCPRYSGKCRYLTDEERQ